MNRADLTYLLDSIPDGVILAKGVTFEARDDGIHVSGVQVLDDGGVAAAAKQCVSINMGDAHRLHFDDAPDITFDGDG